MLDQLQMAIRRYEQIAPNPGSAMTPSQADQLADWLERQVSRITESLLARPGFRGRVRWPIERLTGEVNCRERETVKGVDDALVRMAKALISLARDEKMARQLLRLGPLGEQVSEGDVKSLDLPLEDGLRTSTPRGLSTVEFIASQPWRDLASPWDYFCPNSQFNLKTPESHSWGCFLRFSNPNLRAPGDYITRCMDIRIDHWRGVLDRFWVRCDTARQRGSLDFGTRWNEFNALCSDLAARTDKLRQLTRSGQEARVRDSCVALLQIHVGFHRTTDLSWLGEVAKMAQGAADIPYRVKQRQEWDIPERAATALLDITDLVRHQPPDELIEEMKATKRLVLIEEQRQAFFDGAPVEANPKLAAWHGRDDLMWELLWTLADRAMVRRNVDCYCLSNRKAQKHQEPPSAQAVKDRRSELKKLITPKLNSLIVDAGRGTYRLELEPEDICLLGWFNDERIDVLMPAAPRHSR